MAPPAWALSVEATVWRSSARLATSTLCHAARASFQRAMAALLRKATTRARAVPIVAIGENGTRSRSSSVMANAAGATTAQAAAHAMGAAV